MSYERTVRAALAETKSKFALAEALAEEIPPRRSGPSEDATINEYLVEARQSIIDAGGEPRQVQTLREYRLTALWVRGGTSTNYSWVPGVSYTAHNEARRAGLRYEDFVAAPKTTDEIRRGAGKASTDGPPEKIAQSWTPEQKASVARELLREPQVAEQVSEEITDYVASDSKRTAEVISKRRQAEPYREVQDRPERDYDAMVETWVNQASVTLAAESSGRWTPNERSQALLYFMTQILGSRNEPTGDQAQLVNDKLESLFSEVEAYANSEVS